VKHDHQRCGPGGGKLRAEGALYAINRDGLGGSRARPGGEPSIAASDLSKCRFMERGRREKGEADPTKLFRLVSAIVPGTGTSPSELSE
jgi:hypothetical protein